MAPVGPEAPVAVDGFPHSDVDQGALLAGEVRVALNEALRFIPLAVGVPLPVGLELEPWTFRLGTTRRVNVQFSGGLTSEPEWYATEKALAGEFRVAVTVRSPVERTEIDAAIQAYLRYDPGFWHTADAYSQKATVSVFRAQ